MDLGTLLSLARKNLGGEMESSARMCLQTAIEHRDLEHYHNARYWALRSLRYSVGVHHPDYQKAERDFARHQK